MNQVFCQRGLIYLFKIKLFQAFDIALRDAQFFGQLAIHAAIFLINQFKKLRKMGRTVFCIERLSLCGADEDCIAT
jgi:hypothetical protein